MEISKSLKNVREKNKLTQTKLAQLLNISPQAISKWEKGISEPSLKDVITMSEIYCITVDELLGRSEQSLNLKLKNFFMVLNSKFAEDPEKTGFYILDYLNSFLPLPKNAETLWDDGGKNLIAGTILYLLELNPKKTIKIDDIYDVLELNSISEKRQENLAKKFSKSSKLVQSHFAGIIENAPTTFKGYISVAKNQLSTLKRKAS